MKKTIVIMPVANEEATMDSVIRQFLSLPYDNIYLYTIIDNYSKDKTEDIIKSYEYTGRIKCIFFPASTGVISCYFEGYKVALADGAEHIIEMDGGGSHLPYEIPQYIEKLNDGYDCVWGSRFIKGGEMNNVLFYRKVLSIGGTLLSNIVLGTSLHDMTSGFEGFQREVLEKFDFDKFLSTGHIYQTEMRFYCRNLHTVEVPIHYIGGNSSLKAKSVFEALKVLFQMKKNELLIYKN